MPGYDGEDQDSSSLQRQADSLGYPLLIKATAGGGGRGMRVVRSSVGFPEELEGARREARASFGDDSVLLERYIEAPRHVEFQVLADAHGSVVHLGERECSVQRRHQKVIEESPSPALTTELREQMGRSAVAVVRAAGYVNAGTVEFILTPEGEYYFLEVNTRLQVEHPVTELVTGLDLVREQLRIAAGEPLSYSQDEVSLRGHAIECRVYAEDPRNNFLPSTGRLLLFGPPSGVGIRNDSGVETGDEVTPYYDPMLAKLIAHAPDRAACIERSLEALSRYAVLGVATNLPLLGSVLNSTEFREGAVSTGFLDKQLPELLQATTLPEEALIVAAGWQLTEPTSSHRNPWREGTWRASGQERVLAYSDGTESYRVTANAAGEGAWRLRIGQGERLATFERAGRAGLLVREGTRVWDARVAENGQGFHVSLPGRSYTLDKPRPLSVEALGQAAGGTHVPDALHAPMPGTVVKVSVREGETVEAGQTLLVLEAMKMEHSIQAPHNGTVRRLPFGPGDQVQSGAVLAELEE